MARLVAELRAEIVQRIASGYFPPDRPLPSCRNLAAMFEAGCTSVHKTLVGLCEEGLLRTVRGRKVYPAPQQVAAAKVRCIIAVHTDVFGANEPYLRPFVATFARECDRRGLAFRPWCLHGLSLRSLANAAIREQVLDPANVSCILSPLPPHDIALLSRQRVPFVVIGNTYAGQARCVMIASGALVAAFLDFAAREGRSRVGYLELSDRPQGAGPHEVVTELTRQCPGRGLRFDEGLHVQVGHLDVAAARMRHFFQADLRDAALLVGGDLLCAHAVRAVAAMPPERAPSLLHYSDTGESQGLPMLVLPIPALVSLAIRLLLGEEHAAERIVRVCGEGTEQSNGRTIPRRLAAQRERELP